MHIVQYKLYSIENKQIFEFRSESTLSSISVITNYSSNRLELRTGTVRGTSVGRTIGIDCFRNDLRA